MQAIYLDHAASTPVRAEVRAAMLAVLESRFGNPSSAHRWGREARATLEEARERVAAVLGAERREILFTACGTESDNLAVLGRWRACDESAASVVCSAVEHKAVLLAAKQANREGARLVLLGVDSDGRVDADAVAEAFAAKPCVVSVMWGNNEVGTIQPVREIAEQCRAAGVVFHSDAVQSFGKVRIRVDETPCALLSLGAHKFGGPKGVGVLYVRDGVRLTPLEYGGGQEQHLRPGTENVVGAVGFAIAAELAAREQEAAAARLSAWRDRMQAQILARVDGASVNGGGERLPHILNVSVPGADQEALLVALDLAGLAVSVASACQSGASEPSHVLAAMGRVQPDAASIRISLGHASTEEEVRRAADAIPGVIERVRARAMTA